jgi:hypothetical protein
VPGRREPSPRPLPRCLPALGGRYRHLAAPERRPPAPPQRAQHTHAVPRDQRQRERERERKRERRGPGPCRTWPWRARGRGRGGGQPCRPRLALLQPSLVRHRRRAAGASRCLGGRRGSGAQETQIGAEAGDLEVHGVLVGFQRRARVGEMDDLVGEARIELPHLLRRRRLPLRRRLLLQQLGSQVLCRPGRPAVSGDLHSPALHSPRITRTHPHPPPGLACWNAAGRTGAGHRGLRRGARAGTAGRRGGTAAEALHAARPPCV